MTDRDRARALWGTDEAEAPPRLLRAGRLTAELDAGNLRHIAWDGREVMRAVSFIVRDRNWATYNPRIEGLEVEETADGFRVRYRATAEDAGQRFSWQARIEGSERRLAFEATGAAEGPFETNRTGFVVLHPIEGVAGAPVEIEHTDGRTEAGRFPELIDPMQPMLDLRALTHEPLPGLRLRCEMQGYAFEMEDQRNWGDASYKTYVRPLAEPWPYRLAPGETVEQSVTLTLEGEAAAPAAGAAGGGLTLTGAGRLPAFGVGLRRAELAASAAGEGAAALAALAPGYVVWHHDPRESGPEDAVAAARIAQAAGAGFWMELVVAATEDTAAAAEIAALGAALAAAGVRVEGVQLAAAADLKGVLPGSPWPPAASAEAMARAARAAFPGARIGGGAMAFFTELNRKRPPAGLFDLVGFTTAGVVHAGDDTTVLENLATLPAILASAREIAAGRPLSVGPSAIGMRMNPYGAAPMANPGRIRQAMSEDDPRHGALFGAAHAVGYAAGIAAGGAERLALGGTTGPMGVVGDGGLLPVFHVERLLAAWAGAEGVTARVGGTPLAGLGRREGGGVELLLANLGAAPARLPLPARATGAVLDAAALPAAARDAGFLDRLVPLGETLELDGFAVAHLRLPAA